MLLLQNPGIEYRKSVPAISLASFTGGMGGILNLWIGFTFYTLLEVVEYGFHCIMALWVNRNGTSKVMPFQS